jgi:hypothetical protein
MFVKLVNGDDEKLFPCDSSEKKYLDPDSPAVKSGLDTEGVRVELVQTPPKKNSFLFLPQDGQVIYVMNDGGKTIDTIRYPNGR